MDQERQNPFLLGDRTYDFVKKLVQIIIPAFGTFYITLGQIWGLPRSEEVAGTCLAVATFLGICLGISSAQYKASGIGYDGEIKIHPQVDGPTQVRFVTKTEDPLAIAEKKTVTFKVNTEAPLAEALIEPEEISEKPPLPKRKRSKTTDTNPL